MHAIVSDVNNATFPNQGTFMKIQVITMNNDKALEQKVLEKIVTGLDTYTPEPAQEKKAATKKSKAKVFKYSVSLGKITHKAHLAILALDETFIGTEDYMGKTYFWAYEYRHLLRDYSQIWVKVHTALMNAGLDVSGESEQHEKIIRSYYVTVEKN